MAAMVLKFPQLLTYSIDDNLAPTIDFFEHEMGNVEVRVVDSSSCHVMFFYVGLFAPPSAPPFSRKFSVCGYYRGSCIRQHTFLSILGVFHFSLFFVFFCIWNEINASIFGVSTQLDP